MKKYGENGLSQAHILYTDGIISYEELMEIKNIYEMVKAIEDMSQKHYKHRQMSWSDYVVLGILTNPKEPKRR